ncbi:MAG: putative FeS assembly SUF system protein SufT [Myxococcota bacterium]|jgi:probable FeS assembly SUF system protein SufT
MMDEVSFARAVEVILIPDGDRVPVAEGTRGWVTQVLGGNYTVQLTTGRLVRVSAEDADAIGHAASTIAPAAAYDPDAEVTAEMVWDQLRTCFDPEIPANIVDLGLIYDCVVREAETGRVVDIVMTLTAPGCGMGQVLADDVKAKVEALPGVKEAVVELTFDPPWDMDRMSEEARLELGFVY